MGKTKRRFKEPWRRIHGAIWLIGLAILAWREWWWPGILVLVALSSVLEAVLMLAVPEAFEVIEPGKDKEKAEGAAGAEAVSGGAAPPATEPYPLHLLPKECPQCGAPLRPHAVEWDHPRAAHCAYCGVLLPLAQQEG